MSSEASTAASPPCLPSSLSTCLTAWHTSVDRLSSARSMRGTRDLRRSDLIGGEGGKGRDGLEVDEITVVDMWELGNGGEEMSWDVVGMGGREDCGETTIR